ncbi:hypothetical protein M4I32_01575 [Microbacterium sp. LRZ72]|uniref:hypothetical protein n=1 Tax=Microbacterium sp. LRZ72 TaxID=2942481 RepID=UPI0029B7AD44|nr:hypothetical protein [Microbacterium sp. LRZ72]MDX2375488.1 hypothetical protein [Microbacterium sp. LRZ72]
MSTPEQPLTRKQLREMQRTGQVPVSEPPADDPNVADASRDRADAVKAPREAPVADEQVDLDSAPLTRRRAREQERIRTASVPVIGADTYTAFVAPAERAEERAQEERAEERRDPAGEEPSPARADEAEDRGEDDSTEPGRGTRPKEAEAASGSAQDAESGTQEPVVTVGPQFGAALLAGDKAGAPLPPSFDELIARNATTTGAMAAPSALILSQTPNVPPLSGPISATGEVLITGSYNLPAGLGSAGGDPRATDGGEIDAVLIDGELPAASSPTPIAASAAVSTVRGSGDIIRPPAPEKGSKLLFTLAITAGALAVALVGVLIVAVVNGVFW